MRIFISYRRADTSEEAHAIYRFLARKYRKSNVFIDVDAIPKGSDFQTELKSALSRTDVLLAMIGERWLEPAEGSATPRLFEEGDFVRMEIAQAVSRGIPVIPVAVGDVQMAALSQLPKDIIRVHRNKPIRYGSVTSKEDCSRLDTYLRRLQRKPRPWRWVLYGASAHLLMLGLAIPTLVVPVSSIQPGNEPPPYLKPIYPPGVVTVSTDGKFYSESDELRKAVKERRGGGRIVGIRASNDAKIESVTLLARALESSNFDVHIAVAAEKPK